jgi:hypothetical protein
VSLNSAFENTDLLRKASKSSPAYRTFYRIIGGFLYAATSSLKRVTGRIFTISKCFHRSNPKLYLLISPKQGSKKILKTIGAYT